MSQKRHPPRLQPRASHLLNAISSTALLIVLLLAPGTLSGDKTATASPATAPRTAELAFTGDILPHLPVVKFARYYARNPYYEGNFVYMLGPPEMYRTLEPHPTDRKYNFTPMFEQISRKLKAADIAICHLETTITSRNPITGYPRFRAPIELVEAIAESGWDGCSLASNHAFDFGADGVTQTIQAMQQNGLGFTGAAIDEESRRAAHYHANGIHIGHLSYTYGLNGAKVPKNESWWVNLIDVDAITGDAATARAEGAEFIVVSLHWGEENRRMPTASQKRIAQAIAQLGMVDLLIGHHAHVLQPIDRIDDLWVAYGMGNFLALRDAVGCGGVRGCLVRG